MNAAFTIRELCPGCHHDSCSQLYTASLSYPPISEYLEAFYAPQGGIDLSSLKGGQFVLMECGQCGLIFQREILSERLMYRLYEEWIDPKRSLETYEAETGMNHVMAQIRQIADLIHFIGRPPKQIQVLDYGMGWGHWCRLASAMGLDVNGHELSLAKAEHAAIFGIKNLTRQELHTHSFDFINVDQVFEHLAYPLETLVELVQILRPGGLIRIGVPDGWNIKKRLTSADWRVPKQARQSLNPVAPLEHVNCFNHAALFRMASKAGLEPARVPSRYALSCSGRIKSLLRPIYYFMRGTPGTTLYFRRPG
jgi:SAM-dependent methyltransferase